MCERFTQGEWTAHIGIMEPTFVHTGKEDDYVDGETPVICELHHGIKKKHQKSVGFDFDSSEMRANAHLIAAAPEMLKMLDEVGSDLAVALASTPGIECEVWQDILKEDIQKICTVLKKARGEE